MEFLKKRNKVVKGIILIKKPQIIIEQLHLIFVGPVVWWDGGESLVAQPCYAVQHLTLGEY